MTTPIIACLVCKGTGRVELPCTLCGDSTYDHNCNDREVPCAECGGRGEQPESQRLRTRVARAEMFRRRGDALLREWLETPFFEREGDWREWVRRFRPRVENHLLDSEDA